MKNRFKHGEKTNVRVGQREILNSQVVVTRAGNRRGLLAAAAARGGHHGGSFA